MYKSVISHKRLFAYTLLLICLLYPNPSFCFSTTKCRVLRISDTTWSHFHDASENKAGRALELLYFYASPIAMVSCVFHI